MLDRHRHADRTILVFHQLNRTYHNAANSQLAQRNLQDVNNPMVLFVLFQALEREDAGIPTQKKLAELLHVSPATVATSARRPIRQTPGATGCSSLTGAAGRCRSAPRSSTR